MAVSTSQVPLTSTMSWMWGPMACRTALTRWVASSVETAVAEPRILTALNPILT